MRGRPKEKLATALALPYALNAALLARDPLAALVTSPCAGVYVFDAFTPQFCAKLLVQFDRHERDAPNTMNKYGLVLRDAGYGALCEHLLREVAAPLACRFYPHVGLLKSYHGFTVDYDTKKQGSLDLHVDDAFVTLNVCLGRKFTGGKLVFRDADGKITARLDHVVGRAVLHLGDHQHEAQKIRTGTRSNLILWCRK